MASEELFELGLAADMYSEHFGLRLVLQTGGQYSLEALANAQRTIPIFRNLLTQKGIIVSLSLPLVLKLAQDFYFIGGRAAVPATIPVPQPSGLIPAMPPHIQKLASMPPSEASQKSPD